jgi:hypothetical protein
MPNFAQVNNAIFKIHRDLIARQSVVIHDMLALSGSHEQGQVVLQGDSVSAWERVMELLYPE